MYHALLMALLVFSAHAESGVVEDVLDAESGTYHVLIDKGEKAVDVTRNPVGSSAAPELRMFIRRKNKRPLEVRLHAMDRPDGLTQYKGRLDQWSGSMVGFELQFRFDKKSWKRLLKRSAP